MDGKQQYIHNRSWNDTLRQNSVSESYTIHYIEPSTTIPFIYYPLCGIWHAEGCTICDYYIQHFNCILSFNHNLVAYIGTQLQGPIVLHMNNTLQEILQGWIVDLETVVNGREGKNTNSRRDNRSTGSESKTEVSMEEENEKRYTTATWDHKIAKRLSFLHTVTNQEQENCSHCVLTIRMDQELHEVT